MPCPMDAKVVAFYRDIFADLTVDREEAAELNAFLASLNPPPDKLLWIRATAFRIAAEFLSEDSKDANVSLLRTVNYLVHAVEANCMQAKELDGAGPVDPDVLTEFYTNIFADHQIVSEENAELVAFFKETSPPDAASMTTTRALAFKAACENLSEENDKEHNVQLLRCVNAVVHAFELTCLTPNPFELHDEGVDLSMGLSEAVQHLWDLDDNRLDPNRDYRINVQSGKKPYWKEDKAEDPLFDYLDQSVLRRPTYAAFVSLLDNYSAETGVDEVVTHTERAEVKRFLRAILETPPMQFCHRYCHEQKPDLVPADRDGFLQVLQKIWFDLYRRDGARDSSGFEHVFVGEIKEGKISGFHNWIQLYKEEKAGALDYRGYIKPRGSGEARTDDNDHLLTIQFTWKGIEKTVGSSFFGTSPEFEFALYSLCFLVGDQENEISLTTDSDTFEMLVKCYRMSRDKVGTAFPEIKSHYD